MDIDLHEIPNDWTPTHSNWPEGVSEIVYQSEELMTAFIAGLDFPFWDDEPLVSYGQPFERNGQIILRVFQHEQERFGGNPAVEEDE